MIGPFRPEQGTSFHETVIDVAVIDDKMILLTDEEGAINNNNNYTDKTQLYSFTC